MGKVNATVRTVLVRASERLGIFKCSVWLQDKVYSWDPLLSLITQLSPGFTNVSEYAWKFFFFFFAVLKESRQPGEMRNDAAGASTLINNGQKFILLQRRRASVS